jgi:hypothetical protein
MLSTSTGPLSIGASLTTRIVNSSQPQGNVGDAFQMTGWTEVQ